jgi:hypothetical protein
MVLNVSFRHASGYFAPAALAAGLSLDLAMSGFSDRALRAADPAVQP